ncbi:MAG: sensor histidine kinase [Gammaproteobacteria bacterium]|nr:sensor histidine kinase [Gammaproteobacteria bacterium]
MKIPAIIQRWGLIRTFAYTSFVSIITFSVVSGFIFYSFMRNNLLHREMIISSEFIQSIALINDPDTYFSGSPDSRDKLNLQAFVNQVIGLPDVYRATIYDDDFKIIWSDDKQMIGRAFTDNDELVRAYAGINTYKEGHVNDRAKEEHSFLPDGMKNFIESYIPVWNPSHQKVVGVIEIYKSPRALYETFNVARTLVIAVCLFGGIVLYWFLYWIVRTAHQLIENQRERIRHASGRTVELNEQNLRRIGSELHDGPAQQIGFALLRMDSIMDDSNEQQVKVNTEVIARIQSALKDALQEIRNLSSGLVIPDLKDLSAQDAILKVIEKHQKRTSTKVSHKLNKIPDSLKLSSKICIYRLVQEGLNNAYRHGKGIDQKVRATIKDRHLIVIVSDGGQGFQKHDLDKINDSDHLGLRGLRERVESLGGSFKISSEDNMPGCKLIASLPLYD